MNRYFMCCFMEIRTRMPVSTDRCESFDNSWQQILHSSIVNPLVTYQSFFHDFQSLQHIVFMRGWNNN